MSLVKHTEYVGKTSLLINSIGKTNGITCIPTPCLFIQDLGDGFGNERRSCSAVCCAVVLLHGQVIVRQD